MSRRLRNLLNDELRKLRRGGALKQINLAQSGDQWRVLAQRLSSTELASLFLEGANFVFFYDKLLRTAGLMCSESFMIRIIARGNSY
jgi:hypothetical protein